MQLEQEQLRRLYSDFNARNIDAVLASLAPDVKWPNGMEGGYVYGHDAVRAYWTRQWAMIDSHVEPVGFTTEEDGRIAIDVHQVVRSLDGQILADQHVEHVYDIADNLVRSMEIRHPET